MSDKKPIETAPVDASKASDTPKAADSATPKKKKVGSKAFAKRRAGAMPKGGYAVKARRASLVDHAKAAGLAWTTLAALMAHTGWDGTKTLTHDQFQTALDAMLQSNA